MPLDIDVQRPQTFAPRETPLPSLDTGNINNATPKPTASSDLESKLKAEGSSTSGLSMILAILGAAKGDFRGLQAIEDSKRKTALGKSILPEIRKVESMTNTGKYKEAGTYLNEVVAGYGPRAEYLEPYFRQMAARINDREKRFESANSLMNQLDEVTPAEHVNRPIIDAWKKGLAKGDLPSEEGFNNFMVRMAPHIQQLNDRVSLTSGVTGKTVTSMLPQVTSAKDVDDYVGTKVAGENNIDVRQLADVMNNVSVKTSDGKIITPGSVEASTIRARYNSLQPLIARSKIVSNLPLEPTLIAQLLEDMGPEAVAFREFGRGDVTKAIKGQLGRQTEQVIAQNIGTQESDYSAIAKAGMVPVDFDDQSSTFLNQINKPMTYADVKKAGGSIGLMNPDVLSRQVMPAKEAIQGLELIPQMLSGNTLQTRGDVIASGLNNLVSSYLGYPLTDVVDIRQRAKAILGKAIEQVENASAGDRPISSQDSKVIKDLKSFATGDFKSNEALLRAVEYVRTRLGQVITRATGLTLPESQTAVSPTLPAKRQPSTDKKTYNIPGGGSITVDRKSKSIVGEKATVTDEQGKAMPYTVGPIKLPVELEKQIKDAETGKPKRPMMLR